MGATGCKDKDAELMLVHTVLGVLDRYAVSILSAHRDSVERLTTQISGALGRNESPFSDSSA